MDKKFRKMKAKNIKTVDRRIQKTKKALTEALINLILDKGYEEVTVQDIIDKANVGRSTFYIHYESKEQLLLDGHRNLNIDVFFEENDKEKVSDAINFTNLFQHISEMQPLAKAMFGKKSGALMTDFFKNNISMHIRMKYIQQFKKNTLDQKTLSYLADACGAMIVSLIVSWLEDNMPFSAIDMARNCQSIVSKIFVSPNF